MIPRLFVADRTRWELLAGALLVGVATALVAGGSFFHRDDFVFVEYFELNPLTTDTFFRSWFGHLVPGYIAFLVSFLAIFGLSWPAALVIISLINIGAFVALTRILDEVLGRARFNVIAGLAFSLSLGPLISRMWWAATLTNMLPLALGLAVLGCATRWVVRRRARHLVAALAIFAVALAMSEKNLLFSAHIAMWCVLVVWRGRPFRERVREVVRTWALWVGLFVLSLIDVVAFLTGGYVEESGSSPSVGTSIAFIADSVIGGQIPSIFGMNMEKAVVSLLDPRILVASAIFFAFLVWTIVRDRSNSGVWLFALIGVLANIAAVSRRADILGITGGRNLRYLLESTALLWLAIGVVLVMALRASIRRANATPTKRPVRVIQALALTGAVAVAAMSAWFWSNGVTNAISQNEGRTARAWVEKLGSTLPDPPPPLIDSPLPASFGLPPLHPYDMVAPVLPSLGWTGVTTTTSLDGSWVVGPDGAAGPAHVADGKVAFSGTECTDGSFPIAIPDALSPGRKYIVLQFSGATGESVAFALTGGWTSIELTAESGTVVAYVAAPFDGDLSIDAQGSPLCVETVTVGDILPASSAGINQ